MEDYREERITCPHCGGTNCYESEYMDKVSYLCTDCGYTSTDSNEIDSFYIMSLEENTPQIIKDLKFDDKERNIVWYPVVLRVPSKGVITPAGTADNWYWTMIPIKFIPEKDQINYPVEGQPDKFYESILDVDNAQTFETFMDACKYLGIVMGK